jgi:hypothetical protein
MNLGTTTELASSSPLNTIADTFAAHSAVSQPAGNM